MWLSRGSKCPWKLGKLATDALVLFCFVGAFRRGTVLAVDTDANMHGSLLTMLFVWSSLFCLQWLTAPHAGDYQFYCALKSQKAFGYPPDLNLYLITLVCCNDHLRKQWWNHRTLLSREWKSQGVYKTVDCMLDGLTFIIDVDRRWLVRSTDIDRFRPRLSRRNSKPYVTFSSTMTTAWWKCRYSTRGSKRTLTFCLMSTRYSRLVPCYRIMPTMYIARFILQCIY